MSENMVKIAVEAIENKKGEDIKVIDISEITVLADYFIVVGGSNKSQIQAIADSVEEQLARASYLPKQIEGYAAANWILMDYGDIVIHIFDHENRDYYNIERIWRDGKFWNAEQIEKLS